MIQSIGVLAMANKTATYLKSELAIDLALSRLIFVALKASLNQPVTVEERSVAESLRDALKQKLNLLTCQTDLSDATVPEKAIREQLQRTLTMLSEHSVTNTIDTNNRLRLFINLLDQLSKDEISAADVERCLGEIMSLEKRKPATLPDVSQLAT